MFPFTFCFSYTICYSIVVEIWSIIDILRDAAAHPEYSFKLNEILVKKIIGYIIQLNNICTDRMGNLHNKIHPLKYVLNIC